jgi:hypothetical protein
LELTAASKVGDQVRSHLRRRQLNLVFGRFRGRAVKIRYEVTVDDLLAFVFYRSGRSSRRIGAVAIVWGVVAPLGLIAVMAALLGQQAAIMTLPLAGVAVLFIRILFKTGFWPNTQRTLRRQYEELLPKGVIGPHEMELVENGLVEKTPHSEHWMLLKDVQGISSDGDRTFIYTGPAAAYVIPHRSVPDGELETFVEAIRMRLPGSSAEPSAAADPARVIGSGS